MILSVVLFCTVSLVNNLKQEVHAAPLIKSGPPMEKANNDKELIVGTERNVPDGLEEGKSGED